MKDSDAELLIDLHELLWRLAVLYRAFRTGANVALATVIVFLPVDPQQVRFSVKRVTLNAVHAAVEADKPADA